MKRRYDGTSSVTSLINRQISILAHRSVATNNDDYVIDRRAPFTIAVSA